MSSSLLLTEPLVMEKFESGGTSAETADKSSLEEPPRPS